MLKAFQPAALVLWRHRLICGQHDAHYSGPCVERHVGLSPGAFTCLGGYVLKPALERQAQALRQAYSHRLRIVGSQIQGTAGLDGGLDAYKHFHGMLVFFGIAVLDYGVVVSACFDLLHRRRFEVGVFEFKNATQADMIDRQQLDLCLLEMCFRLEVLDEVVDELFILVTVAVDSVLRIEDFDEKTMRNRIQPRPLLPGGGYVPRYGGWLRFVRVNVVQEVEMGS